ncbi:MAG: rRNA maturation RNase YbeY [Gemmataceae bacterium]
MGKIAIACPQEAVEIDRKWMREVVRKVLEGEGKPDSEISLAFVDNPTIHRLNKRFLDHDEPTDVLSFPLGESAGKISGELVIGAEVARDRAGEMKIPVQHELTLYVIHGLLHLCGMDDHDDVSRRKMRQRERRYLEEMGIPDITSAEDS